MVNSNDEIKLEMEITRRLLTEHLLSQAFIGKSKQHCYAVKLTFEQGFVEWSIENQVPAPFPADASKLSPAVLYFDSFFGFTDYVEAINAICHRWLQVNFAVERINLLADLFKEYFPWSKFVLGCNVALELPNLAYADFGSDSFVRYLQQVLAVDTSIATIQRGITSMTYFLNQLGVREILTTVDFDLEKLDLAVKGFYHQYVNEWVPKLRLVCQATDKNDVPTAILIAERCGISALAVHRYLIHVETMSTPEQQKQIARDARVARYESKS